MSRTFPDLPYDYDALEPHISEQTLRLHHGKHHRKYFETMIQMIDGTQFEDMTPQATMAVTVHDEKHRTLFNNVAQFWNHSFFWNCMSRNGGGSPKGDLGGRLKSTFGGVEGFKEAFIEAASDEFGSGWAWLVLDHEALRVVTTADALNPLTANQIPLLTCDVWEHAYYLDYQNRRPDFVQAFLDHLVNWSFVARQLDSETRMAA